MPRDRNAGRRVDERGRGKGTKEERSGEQLATSSGWQVQGDTAPRTLEKFLMASSTRKYSMLAPVPPPRSTHTPSLGAGMLSIIGLRPCSMR